MWSFLKDTFLFLLKGNEWRFILVFVLTAVCVVIQLLAVSFSKFFIDNLTTGMYGDILTISKYFLICVTLLVIFETLKQFQIVNVTEFVQKKNRIKIFNWAINNQLEEGFDSLHRSNVELPQLINFVINTLPTAILDIFAILFVLLILASFDVKLLLIVFVVTGMNLLLIFFINPKLLAKQSQSIEIFNKITNTHSELLNVSELIRWTGAYQYASNKIENELNQNLKTKFELRNIQMFAGVISSIIILLPQVFLFVYGGMQVINGSMTLGSLVLGITYIQLANNKISNLFTINLTFQSMKIMMHNYLTYCEKTENKKILSSPINKLQVSNVYLGENKNKINFELYKGDTMVISGANGSGKTTLLKKILGIFPLENGNIFYNDSNINQISFNIENKNLGVVTQNQYLFNDTIRENINLGRKLDDNKIIDLYNKIFQMNVDSDYLSNNAYELSGGEKRRVEIIRAFIDKPDVIILDEPDTFLDKESFTNLTKYFFKNCNEQIKIIVTHEDIKIKTENIQTLYLNAS